MYLFLPRSLCALKRLTNREHARYAATQGIHLVVREGLFRAEVTDGRRAIVVQGAVPEDAPWPAFVHTPDDAFEAVILPEDLDRAVKVSKGTWAGHRDVIGVATIGPNDVCIGRGPDMVMARQVEGRFPAIDQVIPATPPVVSFKVDPRLLANTLLTISELLPDHDQRVDIFYYGEGVPIRICARNSDNGMMVDALLVPLVFTGTKVQPKEEAAAEEDPDDQIEQLWTRAQKEHPDKLTLILVGDRYEAFGDDAHCLAEHLELEVMLTDNRDDVAGFHKAALENHLPTLLAAGVSVAIYDLAAASSKPLIAQSDRKAGPRDEEADFAALKQWIDTRGAEPEPQPQPEAAAEREALLAEGLATVETLEKAEAEEEAVAAEAAEPEPQPEPKGKRGRKGRKAA